MADDIKVSFKKVDDNSSKECINAFKPEVNKSENNINELIESSMNDIINEKNIGKNCCAILTSYEDEQKGLYEKIKLSEKQQTIKARIIPYDEKEDEKAKEIIKANEKLKKLFGF